MFSLHDPISDDTRESLKSFDDLTASLLSRRGITTPEEAESFLFPSYDEHIGDPLQIKNMEKAAKRVAKAIENNERIAVWSDYDCDGIPGGVVLHDFFKKAEANFCNYIPHRHEEGFGLNEMGLDKLAADGVILVITVDCGIADVAGVAYANSIGLEIIITDHHLPGEVLPDAFTIVDAKQDGEEYPYKDFCGGGMAWKLVCAVLAVGFSGREKIPTGWEKWLLDMAGLSTIADMVPLTGENRVIAKYGLLVMRKSPRLGLQKLCKAARVDQRRMTEDDVGFMVAPRINAASRMGDAMDAFKLLITEDENEADMLAKKLEAINRSRRASGAAVTKKVHERLEERKQQGELPKVIVMGDPEWRPGLLGLVANSIAEEYQRPVFLWGREGSNTLKGSCRAGRPEIHLLQLMQAVEAGTFVDFGGHRASGGYSIREDAVHFLDERLQNAYASLTFNGILEVEKADSPISFAEASLQLLSKVDRLAPFGMGNPKPTFLLTASIQNIAWFGKSGEHLRLRLSSGELSFSDDTIEAISFYAKRQLGNQCLELAVGAQSSLLVTLERDFFTRGQPIRLRLVAVS
jgi:single-stranded-DNA-specific exonuclease